MKEHIQRARVFCHVCKGYTRVEQIDPCNFMWVCGHYSTSWSDTDPPPKFTPEHTEQISLF